ncbi:MAG: hypothetical protein KDD67_17100 [Ignavibacteriae bacterium]|nr:hypothetical protein [Ignavibacteriota bacterium]MCB9214277.1 hypothetical protein [Ignavibacteria bacterium]
MAINPIIIDPLYVRYFGKPVARSLSSIIGAFKSAVSRQAKICFPEIGSIWQSRFYDHIIRDTDDLQRIRKYIQANPMRWELDRENGMEEDNNGWHGVPCPYRTPCPTTPPPSNNPPVFPQFQPFFQTVATFSTNRGRKKSQRLIFLR